MRNPFVLSGYVSAEYFCDREAETKELTRKALNGNNVALISMRRMGKTGLIEHCYRQKELAGSFYAFYIDIYATSNLQEFVFKLGKEIFDSLKPRGKQFIENFFALISSLRPAFKLDELTGTPVFDVGIGEISKPEFTLEEIFNYLQNADKPCIVAIDEFQQIVNYPEKNIEAVLRTHIQRATNSTFIFAGSRRQIMQNIFFSSSQPFYQSVSLVSLSAIDVQEYTKFVKRHFENAEKQIPEELIVLVYNLFEGHTWYLQAVFNELFSLLDKGENCDFPMIEFAVRNKIFSFEPMFQNTLQLISQRQKELLYAIAKEGKAAGITSGKFIKKHGLQSSGSVQAASNQLLEKEIITSENGVYQVYDRFFGLWLSEVYGTGFKIKK